MKHSVWLPVNLCEPNDSSSIRFSLEIPLKSLLRSQIVLIMNWTALDTRISERNAIYPRGQIHFCLLLALALVRFSSFCLPARINVYSLSCRHNLWCGGSAEIASRAPDMTVMRPLTQLTLALISSQLETWALNMNTNIVGLTENIIYEVWIYASIKCSQS